MLEVQKFLDDEYEDGLDRLTELFGIKVRRYPEDNLVLLDYNQIDSPKTHPIVIECRSLILALDTLEVVSRKFDRFFNLGEAPDLYKDFDFESAVVMEKADGSLIGVYFNPHTRLWEISTRGMAKAEGEHVFGGTFREKVLKAFGFTNEADFQSVMNENWHEGYTYIFEYCGPENRIVTKYNTAQMVLTGVTDNATGEQAPFYFLEECAQAFQKQYLFVRPPQKFDLESDDFVAEANKLDGLQEGFVIWCEKTGRRVKVKAHTYMVAHKLRGNDAVPTRKNLFALVLEGEVDEFLVYFPEWKELITSAQAEVDVVEKSLIDAWLQHKDIESQKDFALAVKDRSAAWTLFQARMKKSDPITVFHAAPLAQKLKVFGV